MKRPYRSQTGLLIAGGENSNGSAAGLMFPLVVALALDCSTLDGRIIARWGLVQLREPIGTAAGAI